MDTAGVEAVVAELMTSAEITGYQVTYSPGVDVGDAVAVGVSVPWANIAIINIPLLPKPANISASVTMAKEGPGT